MNAGLLKRFGVSDRNGPVDRIWILESIKGGEKKLSFTLFASVSQHVGLLDIVDLQSGGL